MPEAVAKPASSVGMAQTVHYSDAAQQLDKGENDKLIHQLSTQIKEAKASNDTVHAAELTKTLAVQEDWKYFSNLPADQRPAPNTDLKLVSTELYQSINLFGLLC